MSYVDNAQRHDAILMREETGNEVVPLQWRKKKREREKAKAHLVHLNIVSIRRRSMHCCSS